jgi:hypothetical protein
MGMPDKWSRNPRPDPAVVQVAHNLQHPSAEGQVRAIAVVTVDPMLNVEAAVAGDIDSVRKRILAAGLIELAHKILSA